MGYSTEFQGILKFTKELTIPELRMLNSVLGKDIRAELPKEAQKLVPLETSYPGSKEKSPSFYYVDLEVTDNMDGIKWNESEKSYGMDKQVQFILDYMHTKFPDFSLTGYMDAQGEDIDDRWRLVMRDGKAIKVMRKPTGKKVTCPHCEEDFYIDCEKTE